MLLDGHEAKLSTLPEFVALGDVERAQVLQRSQNVRRTIESERFVSSIRDKLSRYTSEDYPAQLALVGRLAAAAHPGRAPGDDAGEDAPVTPRYVSASSLRPDCGLPYIVSEADLDRWLAALRAAAAAELAKGHRISL